MSNLLTKIVTPAFITVNAHLWFAYAVMYTFFGWPTGIALAVGCGVKEFYVDKHFEVAQSFMDNLKDWLGYMAGLSLAIVVHHWLY